MEKKKDRKKIIIIFSILSIGIVVWFWLNGNKGNGDGLDLGGGEDATTSNGEIATKGEACWLPLPSYPNMIKFTEQKDEKAGNFFAMYGIEGSDKAEEIKDFYNTKALADGWELDNEMFMEESWILIFSKGKDYSLQVSVGYSEGSTQLTIACSGPSQEEKENPYDSAKEVKSIPGLNTTFHNDFKAVLDSVFGGAKLTSAGSDKYSEDLDYIVKRQIIEEDAQETRDKLQEKGYETTSTSAGSDRYDYDFSKEVLGKEYDDISLTVRLAEEGSYQQKVRFVIYK